MPNSSVKPFVFVAVVSHCQSNVYATVYAKFKKIQNQSVELEVRRHSHIAVFIARSSQAIGPSANQFIEFVKEHKTAFLSYFEFVYLNNPTYNKSLIVTSTKYDLWRSIMDLLNGLGSLWLDSGIQLLQPSTSECHTYIFQGNRSPSKIVNIVSRYLAKYKVPHLAIDL